MLGSRRLIHRHLPRYTYPSSYNAPPRFPAGVLLLPLGAAGYWSYLNWPAHGEMTASRSDLLEARVQKLEEQSEKTKQEISHLHQLLINATWTLAAERSVEAAKIAAMNKQDGQQKD